MYDNFEPFQKMTMQDFTFSPSRFEIWMSGKMVGSGESNFPIIAKVINHNNLIRTEVVFGDSSLHHEISLNNIFDTFISINDRLQLITIPEGTNDHSAAIEGYRTVFGATRKYTEFKRNEPFSCNLFFQQGSIAKITFSFSNPEKLIEFYS